MRTACFTLVLLVSIAAIAPAQERAQGNSADSITLVRKHDLCAGCRPHEDVALRARDVPAWMMDTIVARAVAAGFFQLPRSVLGAVPWCQVALSDNLMATLTIHRGRRAFTVSGYRHCVPDDRQHQAAKQRLVDLEALIDSVALGQGRFAQGGAGRAAGPGRSQAGSPHRALTIGIAKLDTAGGGCLAINAAGLAPGTPLTLVWMPTDTSSDWSPELLEARIQDSRSSPCDPRQAPAPGDLHYSISVPAKSEIGAGPHFAVLRARSSLKMTGPRVEVDLDGDGVPEVFRSCTSSEGLHMTVWSGAPLTGTRRWHRYYYLGYDVEPSCDPRDYKS